MRLFAYHCSIASLLCLQVDDGASDDLDDVVPDAEQVGDLEPWEAALFQDAAAVEGASLNFDVSASSSL